MTSNLIGNIGSSMGQMHGMGRMQGLRQPPSADDLIKKMDTDGNGTLGADEVKGPMAKDFAKIDSDQDGQISKDELQKAMEAFHKQIEANKGKSVRLSPADLIKKLDSNNDGTLDATEAKGPLAKHFAKIDTNNDGNITLQELEDRVKKMQSHSLNKGFDKDQDSQVSSTKGEGEGT